LVKKTDRRKSQPFLFLGLFLIAWWGIPASWKIFTKSAFAEFHAPLWDLSSRTEDLSNYWGHLSDSKETLIEKAKNSSRLQAGLDLQGDRNNAIQEEIVRLRSLEASLNKLETSLNLGSSQGFEPIIARVSHRSLSGWWQKITIRKGSSHGIKPGLGVISNRGVVGRIKSVGRRSSEIELITNPSFRMVAHFEGDDRPVTFQGSGIALGGIPVGLALDVPHDLTPTPEKPHTLISSDLSAIFPRGVPLGVVKDLGEGEEGLFKSGNVTLDLSLNQLMEVTVLVPRQ
jgi:rod shape-determining protein MreC